MAKIPSLQGECERCICVSCPPGALAWEEVPSSSSLWHCFYTWCINNQDTTLKSVSTAWTLETMLYTSKSYTSKSPVSSCPPHPVAPTLVALATPGAAVRFMSLPVLLSWSYFFIFVDTFNHSAMLHVLFHLVSTPYGPAEITVPSLCSSNYLMSQIVSRSCMESTYHLYQAKLLSDINLRVLIGAAPSLWDLDMHLIRGHKGNRDTHGVTIGICIFLQHEFILFGPSSLTFIFFAL